MTRRKVPTCRWWFGSLLVSFTVLFAAASVTVAEEGTFTGTWIASGTRQLQPFVADREVFTFQVKGHVNLTDSLGEVADFWSECSGLYDAAIGGTARCLWRGMEGQIVYIMMNSQPLKEGGQVTAEIVGGTGKLEGVTGTFHFTWSSVFINEDTNTITGHAKDISGSYRVP